VAPILLSPIDGATDQPTDLDLSWAEVPGAVEYEIEYADNAAFSGSTSQTTSGTSLALSGLATNTTIFWHLRASNAGGTGPFSEVRSFSTVPPAPVAPILLSPIDGAIDQPTDLILEWNGVDGATEYEVQYADNAGFAGATSQTTSGTSVNLTGLATSTTLFWRVRASNTGGTGPFSEVRSFSTVPPAPVAPTLLSPIDGATDQPTDLDLSWAEVPDAVEYEIEYANNAGFAGATSQTTAGTSLMLSGLADNTTIFWHVRASNTGGTGPFSDTWQFTTAPPAPVAPVLVSPGNGSYFDSQSTTLNWSAVPGATEYDLQVATDPLFLNLVVDMQGITGASFDLSGLVLNTRYDWRVRARNAGGESDWSVFSFCVYPNAIPIITFRDFGDASLTEQYRMVGLPGAVDLPIGAMFTGVLNRDWVVYAASFVENESIVTRYDGSDRFRFQPGEGFWMLSRTPWNIDDVVPTVPMEADKTYPIPLHNGWNIIANPFGLDVPWSLIQSVNGITRALHQFADQYTESATLKPFEGFYFYNEENLDELRIPYPPAFPDQAAAAKSFGHSDASGLQVRVYRQDQAVGSIEVAIAPDATDDLDPFDRLAPPADFQSVRLAIRNEALSTGYKWLSREVISDLGSEGRVFELELKAPHDKPLSVRIESYEALAEYEIYLVDPVLSKFYDLRADANATLVSSADVSRYLLVVGTASLVAQMRAQIVPEQTALVGNYPNPFRDQTNIEYTLSSAEDVLLDVYNVLGQRVRRLVDNQQEAGRYTLIWDGKDEQGTPVSSGMYVYRLQIGRWSQSHTMMQIR
jgi:hypothetical protein